MHVRVRLFGKPEAIVVVESKLTKIEQFRHIIMEKFDVDIKLQRLLYGGKLLEDGYTFHDYNIKLNDVIQLMIKIQSERSPEEAKTQPIDTEVSKSIDDTVSYEDAISTFYAIGDLIDMRDREQGAWYEGKIVRIVHKSNKDTNDLVVDNKPDNSGDTLHNSIKVNDPDNKSSNDSSLSSDNLTKKKSIKKYFNITSNVQKKPLEKELSKDATTDMKLLYKIQLDIDDDDSNIYCKITEIRPRARREINVKDLHVGQTVMINHNTDEPLQKGYWYDFTVDEIKKLRTSYELVGTLYLGSEAIPQNDTNIKIHDKIFAIQEVVPLNQRTTEDKKMMVTSTEKRSLPLNCLTCRDDEDVLCKGCGCYLCSGKEHPELIVLCDECNKGYHMQCLNPPLEELPEEDWYCPLCKRDPKEIVAPGAAKQTKKKASAASKSNRDWGRGMACVGKTKTCAMPPNHFGPIPGIEVGMCWRFRIQLSESGIHRPPVSGIHGRDVEGAYSIVLSGGYEDDVDNGYEFTYTGSGGRDLSGNKRTAEQSSDQTLTRENKALARNCAINQISETGGDAGENWRKGKPVRVVRSYKMLKHFPKFAPKEGIRYDGIYRIVKYYPEKGLSGFRVWKYLLRRDDPNPAPWEKGAKQYPMIYPDGFLEAEAEKKAQKENLKNTKGNKRTFEKTKKLKSPPAKKRKMASTVAAKSPKSTLIKPIKTIKDSIIAKERDIINADTLNSKLWAECLEIFESQGKKEFVEHITQVFLCIICQEVAVSPVTTPCLHNFCMVCLKLAFKSTGTLTCPCCRQSLAKYTPEQNDKLKAALQSIMPGYDAGKK